MYGLASEPETLRLDDIFDEDGIIGRTGLMNTQFPGCGGLGHAVLYIGEPGESHPFPMQLELY